MYSLALFVALTLMVQASPTPSTISLSYGDKTARLSADDLAKLPQVQATVRSHNVEGSYEGPQLRDVLASVDVPHGDALRGPSLRLIVAIDAADGYRAVFSLAEFDPAFRDRQVILATRRNGQPLDASEGPFRLVVTDEARPARWVRQVTGIKIVDVRP